LLKPEKPLARTVEFSPFSQRQLAKLDTQIVDWFYDRIEGCKDPRHSGEALKGDLAGIWHYRVGDFRLLCELKDERLIVWVIAIGYRREIYRRK
jgi:mRNA interferase RelE/StbE